MDSYNKFAKIYDELINEDIDYSLYAKKILDIVEVLDVNKEDYLDLACGTGNLSQIISKYFRHSWLVDSSQSMLTEAEDKFRKLKIHPKIICQDMCELNLNRKFDLITCALDGTNYILDIEDLNSYFQSVKEHLKDNGIFIFDINSYYKLSEILGNNIFNYNSEEVFYSWENSFEDNVLEMYLSFFVKNGEMYERFDEEHIERAYKEEELDAILKEIGLKVIYKLDNYDKNFINPKTERIVYVVKK